MSKKRKVLSEFRKGLLVMILLTVALFIMVELGAANVVVFWAIVGWWSMTFIVFFIGLFIIREDGIVLSDVILMFLASFFGWWYMIYLEVEYFINQIKYKDM